MCFDGKERILWSSLSSVAVPLKRVNYAGKVPSPEEDDVKAAPFFRLEELRSIKSQCHH